MVLRTQYQTIRCSTDGLDTSGETEEQGVLPMAPASQRTGYSSTQA